MLHVLVAGVDGARGGWIVAYAALDAEAPTALHLHDLAFVTAIEDVLATAAAVIAIDIPIGLPETGARECDRAARALLRPHGARVFPAPVRATLPYVDDYRRALAAARTASGVGLSKQAWHLLPKIAEVDAVADDARLVECHPEVAFATMVGTVIAARKKSPEGAAARRDAIGQAFAVESGWVPPRLPGARDDVLDALVCAWSAARIARGTAITLGAGADRLGRPMRICA